MYEIQLSMDFRQLITVQFSERSVIRHIFQNVSEIQTKTSLLLSSSQLIELYVACSFRILHLYPEWYNPESSISWIPSSQTAICMLNPLKRGQSGIHPLVVGGALLIMEFGMTFGITTLSRLYHLGNMHSGKRRRPLYQSVYQFLCYNSLPFL